MLAEKNYRQSPLLTHNHLPPTTLSFITINFNSAGQTIRLLESLRQQTDQDFNTFVVDNASELTDLAKLEAYVVGQDPEARSRLKLLKNNQNLGFSGGNNVGITEALKNGPEWLVFINNDTYTTPDFIGQLRAFLKSLRPLVGLVGIPLREGQKTAYYGQIQWLRPTLQHIHDRPMHLPVNTPNRPPYVIGGGVVVRRDVFKKIGLWDERYFLYFEDADLSCRASKAGFTILIAEDIVINHEVSASTSKLGAPLLLRYHARNALLFNWKNGPGYIKLALPFWSFFVIIKQVLKLLVRKNTAESLAIGKGVADFWISKFGKIK